MGSATSASKIARKKTSKPMADPACEYCHVVCCGFCSNCGVAHCDAHALEIPEDHALDSGETGLICPDCAVDLIVFASRHGSGELIREAAAFVKKALGKRNDESEDEGHD